MVAAGVECLLISCLLVFLADLEPAVVPASLQELALMAYRGDIQFPADVGTIEEAPIGQEAEVALKFV